MPFSWHVWPDDTPDGVERFLAEQGMRRAAAFTGMALVGEAWQRVRQARSAKVAIRVVEDEDAFTEWCRTVVDSYGLPPRAMPTTIETHRPVWDQDTRYRYFLAVDGMDGVAASLLFTGAGVAGLHAVAVRPGHRGKGLGRAVSMAALEAGREMRMPLAVLHATSMATGLYGALGFQALTEVTRYDKDV
jgi:GNAT superfamily N-acetyltransferase